MPDKKVQGKSSSESRDDVTQSEKKMPDHFFRSYRDFQEYDFGGGGWLVEDLVPDIGGGFIAGFSKIGKTWFVLDLLLAVASGKSFLGLPTKKGKAIYLGAEGNGTDIKKRLNMLSKGRKIRSESLAEQLYLGIGPKIYGGHCH